jgi:hypothetical protein
MARADRLSRLIAEWQTRRDTLRGVEAFFREHNDTKCVEIAAFGRLVLEQCIADFQRANYPLADPPAALASLPHQEK